MNIDTDSEREFAHNLGYMRGDGPEIRLHLCNLADEVDRLRGALLSCQLAMQASMNSGMDRTDWLAMIVALNETLGVAP